MTTTLKTRYTEYDLDNRNDHVYDRALGYHTWTESSAKSLSDWIVLFVKVNSRSIELYLVENDS